MIARTLGRVTAGRQVDESRPAMQLGVRLMHPCPLMALSGHSATAVESPLLDAKRILTGPCPLPVQKTCHLQPAKTPKKGGVSDARWSVPQTLDTGREPELLKGMYLDR